MIKVLLKLYKNTIQEYQNRGENIMKKIKPILLSLLMLFILMATSHCAEAASNESITYYDDGSYKITKIIDEPTLQPLPGAQTNAAAITSATRSKISEYLNSAGNVMWYVKVTGSFTYTKDSATCHSSSVKAEALGSTWKVSNRSAARSGATAYASATAKHYYMGIVINTMDDLVSLTCHPGGTFS